jgi:xylulose-5-phosphate/fructose-6-phosphate phosphoketolase
VRHAALRQQMADERLACRAWTRRYGEDRPDVRDWVWSADGGAEIPRPRGTTDTDSDFPDEAQTGPDRHDPLADVRDAGVGPRG